MKMENAKSKVAEFFRKVGKKNIVIAASFTVVAIALVVALALFGGADKDGYDYSQGVGNTPDSSQPSVNSTDVKDSVDTYFSSVQLNRQRSRDEALEVLQSVVDNDSSTETAKNEALAEINKLAKVMETEANIETLIVAKGFEECVAVISDEGASIVVKSEGLQAAQISQINEIVYEQAGIDPTDIKIIQR
jgi:stage III sporulation protein AH